MRDYFCQNLGVTMKHIMIDLETMGIKATAPIVAIGAAVFNPETGEIGKTFYQRVDLESAVEQGAIIEANTVKWWLRRNAAARSEITVEDNSHIDIAIHNLSCFFISQGNEPIVWANGASFDFTILRAAIARSSSSNLHFWNYWNEQDVRTILSSAEWLGINPNDHITFDGVKHHAMYDAIHQAKCVSYVWQKITRQFDNKGVLA